MLIVKCHISNPVSGGQCHLIYLTILRRFSWPSLACLIKTTFILFHLLLGYLSTFDWIKCSSTPPSFIVFPLPFNATRCSLTPANWPPTHSNRHLTPLCRPLTITHPILLPLHRILGHTITILTPFRHLLMPRCRTLAQPRRSLTPPHCPLTPPCLP